MAGIISNDSEAAAYFASIFFSFALTHVSKWTRFRFSIGVDRADIDRCIPVPGAICQSTCPKAATTLPAALMKTRGSDRGGEGWDEGHLPPGTSPAPENCYCDICLLPPPVRVQC